MKTLKLMVQGFLIGIGKIIPGVSGSMIAISFGLYDRGVEALSHMFCKKNFLFLCKTGFGLLLALCFFSRFLLFFFHQYPFYTMFFFLGMISSSVFESAKDGKFEKKHLWKTFFVFLLSYVFTTFPQEKIFSVTLHPFFLFFVGFIEAFTMIIPGISGTAILMCLGAYSFVLQSFQNLFSFSYFLENFIPLCFFWSGIFLGTILTTKVLYSYMKRKKEGFHSMIFGFVLFSFYYLLKQTLQVPHTFWDLILSLFLFGVSSFLSLRFQK